MSAPIPGVATVRQLAELLGMRPPSPASAAFLDAASAAPTAKEHARAWKLISASKWPTSPPRMIVRCSGRGSFKTTDGALLTSFHALAVDHDAHALAGTRVYHAIVAPRKAQAAEAVRVAVAVLERARDRLGVRFEVLGERSDEVQIVLTHPRGACERVICAFPADATTPRSRAFGSVHFTEWGRARSGAEYQSTDREVELAILPRLGQFPRAQAYIESTPGPPDGRFYELVTKPPEGAIVVRGSSFEFNPGLDEKTAREWCPDRRDFEQEILATRWGHRGDGWLDHDACDDVLDRTGRWIGMVAA